MRMRATMGCRCADCVYEWHCDGKLLRRPVWKICVGVWNPVMYVLQFFQGELEVKEFSIVQAEILNGNWSAWLSLSRDAFCRLERTTFSCFVL